MLCSAGACGKAASDLGSGFTLDTPVSSTGYNKLVTKSDEKRKCKSMCYDHFTTMYNNVHTRNTLTSFPIDLAYPPH